MDALYVSGVIVTAGGAVEVTRRIVFRPAWRSYRTGRTLLHDIKTNTEQMVDLVESTKQLGEDMRELSGSVVALAVANDQRITSLEERVIQDGPRRMTSVENKVRRLVDEVADIAVSSSNHEHRIGQMEARVGRRRQNEGDK